MTLNTPQEQRLYDTLLEWQNSGKETSGRVGQLTTHNTRLLFMLIAALPAEFEDINDKTVRLFGKSILEIKRALMSYEQRNSTAVYASGYRDAISDGIAKLNDLRSSL